MIAARFAFCLTLASAAHAAAEPEVPCGTEQAAWRVVAQAEPGPDLSAWNEKPAGRHGFVTAKGDELAFSDGTPARFWGANVAAKAIFESSDAAIDAHAARLARLGFNLVRLHHHDSGGWQKRTVLDPRVGGAFDAAGLRKLDRWIARLGEQGVYVWLEIHTGRVFRADEGIPGFAELSHGAAPWPSAKGFLFLNPRLEELTLSFGAALLAHRNAYTGRAYRDDPTIAALLVTNENDLTHHFGNLFTAKRGNAWHRERFLAAAGAFAEKTGLPRAALERTWEPGPSRLLLANLEHGFAERATAALRRAGARVPIASTSYWGRANLAALASLGSGDFVDAHTYAQGDPLRADPTRGLGFLGWAGVAQLPGRPLTVSEWNHGKPLQRERFTSPLYAASVAALQGWDALMLYAYAQNGLDRTTSSLWNAAADPATIALLPAGSAIFRRGDVARAARRITLAPSSDEVFASGDLPERAVSVSTLLEQHGVALALPKTPALPWLAVPEPSGERVADLRRSFLEAGATAVRSDTGELTRRFRAGVLVIDAPRSQGAVGAIAGAPVTTSAARFSAETDAAVALTSLDGEPLERSKRVLVSVAARACAQGRAQWRAERVRGMGWLRAPGPRQLRPLGGTEAARALTSEAGGVAFPLDFGASWAVIEPAGAAQ